MAKKRNYGATPLPKGFKYVRQGLHIPVAVSGMVRRGGVVGKDEEDMSKQDKPASGIEQANKALWDHQRGQAPDFPLVGRDKTLAPKIESKLSPTPKATVPAPKQPASKLDMNWLKEQKQLLARKSEDTDVATLCWLFGTSEGIEHLAKLEKAEDGDSKAKKHTHSVWHVVEHSHDKPGTARALGNISAPTDRDAVDSYKKLNPKVKDKNLSADIVSSTLHTPPKWPSSYHYEPERLHGIKKTEDVIARANEALAKHLAVEPGFEDLVKMRGYYERGPIGETRSAEQQARDAQYVKDKTSVAEHHQPMYTSLRRGKSNRHRELTHDDATGILNIATKEPKRVGEAFATMRDAGWGADESRSTLAAIQAAKPKSK